MRIQCAIGILILAAPVTIAGADSLPSSHVSPDELLEMIEAGEAPTIVDVRTLGEYEAGHVPGALHIPFWATLGRASRIPTPKHEPIVIYCEHGPRAGVAKAAYRVSGFERVVYLRGHMTAWKQAGLEQETGPPTEGPVHDGAANGSDRRPMSAAEE
jgi:rhodanese-related sulfurtransferase